MEYNRICFIRTLVEIEGTYSHILGMSENKTLGEMKEQICQELGLDNNLCKFVMRGEEVDYTSTFDGMNLHREGPITLVVRRVLGNLTKRAR